LILEESKVLDASILTVLANANFVKSSTGFFGGADKKLIKIMLETVKDTNVVVKASGGIRNKKDAEMYIEMGVQRIGTSSGIEIVKELKTNSMDY
jgi:deoxyribose-phosphate aldolase